LWKQEGLQNVQEKPLEIEMKLQSFGDFGDPFLLGQGPAGDYARTVHGEALRALRAAVKSHLSITNESAPFTLTAHVWAVRGTAPRRR